MPNIVGVASYTPSLRVSNLQNSFGGEGGMTTKQNLIKIQLFANLEGFFKQCFNWCVFLYITDYQIFL